MDLNDSSAASELTQRAAWSDERSTRELFARLEVRLKPMNRLRLNFRLPGRINSSEFLQEPSIWKKPKQALNESLRLF